jgi:hypothetical protein
MKRYRTVSDTTPTWRKSSRSQGGGTGDCVEVTVLDDRA